MKNQSKLSFAFLGNGGMSQAVQRVTKERAHNIQNVIDLGDKWNLNSSDVVIECTTPTSFMPNFEQLCQLKKDIVIITTGWYQHKEEVKAMAIEAGIRVIWSSNFSIGVNLYYKIVEAAAKMINQVDEYDVWGHEIHHHNKVDSPSGTAKILSEILLQQIDRKTEVVEDALQRKIKDNEFHFSSTRGGMVNFGHTIGFDSAADVIEIKHTARNRDGYALGAVKAAEWLAKQAPGFYSMDDFLHDTMNKSPS